MEKPKTPLEAVKAAFAQLEAWESNSYDGILGKLPDWVTETVVEKFCSIRRKLLVIGGYSPSEIQRYIETYPERLEVGGMRGVTWIPRPILDDISWLYFVKEAIAEGAEKGLPILIGKKDAREIIRGRKNIKALSQRRKRKPATLPYSNKTIKDVIEELAFNHPAETAKELWVRFLSTLDAEELDPVVTDHPTNLRKSVCVYDIEGVTFKKAFGTFQNDVSTFRKKKS
ncbi:MAG: hypothetical protein K0S36_2095 [Nitrosospira multiformis]|jgi:hypothetical protein|nr:hypothetical protein [Nitrosospira multiformis]